jgi:hypothetical protein
MYAHPIPEELVKEKFFSIFVEIKDDWTFVMKTISGKEKIIKKKYDYEKYYAPGVCLCRNGDEKNLYIVVGMGELEETGCSLIKEGIFVFTMESNGVFFLGHCHTIQEMMLKGIAPYTQSIPIMLN